MSLSEVCKIDLPSLQSIQLGRSTLSGSRFDLSCSLIMRSKNKYIVNTNVDLPKLTSLINSDGYCFFYPRSVTLESSCIYCILSLIDIANLTNLNLTNSFDRVQSKVITSSATLFLLIVDVSAEFVNLVTK